MKRYKTLRKETRKLLSKGEGLNIDFKRNAKLDTEDLVAFANSETGGHILLGVDEATDAQGRMKGRPVGVILSDDLAKTLQGKANSCVPPIDVLISEENTNGKPIVRIDIPPSKKRPHCTGSGTYKIRGLAGNSPLLPSSILEMFLARESNQFVERFTASTQRLTEIVNSVQDKITTPLDELSEQANMTMSAVLSELDETQEILSRKLETIFESADQARCQSQDAQGNLEVLTEQMRNIESKLKAQGQELDVLLKKLDSVLASKTMASK